MENSHRRLPGLDTLRAFAILVVIPWHAMGMIQNPPLRSFGRYGWTGVDLFFVLSGFLICSQLIQSVKRDGRINFRNFYLKRSLRILPAYWMVLLVYILWPDFREAEKFAPPWKFLLFIVNLPMSTKAFSHAWSLCVEEHFYLIMPMAAWWYMQKSRKLHPAVLLGMLFSGGMALRFCLWNFYSEGGTHKWDYWNVIYYPSQCRMDGLIVGVSIALIREYWERLWLRLTAHPWVLFCLGLGFITLGLVAFDGDKQMTASVFAFPCVSLGFGALVIAAMSTKFWLAEWRIPGAAMVATSAYTVYLTHKQMISLAVRMIENPDDHPYITVTVAIALIVAASAILQFFVERPGLALRDRVLRRIG